MCVSAGAQLSGHLNAFLLGLLSLLKSELTLLSLSWRSCIVFQGSVFKIWWYDSGWGEEGLCDLACMDSRSRQTCPWLLRQWDIRSTVCEQSQDPVNSLWHVGWNGIRVPQAILESYAPEHSELHVLVSRQLRCLARRLPKHLTNEELDALPRDLLLFLK